MGLQGVTMGYKGLQRLQRVTRCYMYKKRQEMYMGLQKVTGGYKGLHEVTGGYKGLQGVTRGLQGVDHSCGG